jgi:hypothetical protein
MRHKKKKLKPKLSAAAHASVIREIAQPRMTTSARIAEQRLNAPKKER